MFDVTFAFLGNKLRFDKSFHNNIRFGTNAFVRVEMLWDRAGWLRVLLVRIR